MLVQGLRQDLDTGCPKMAIVKILGHPGFQRESIIYSDYNHKHVFSYLK